MTKYIIKDGFGAMQEKTTLGGKSILNTIKRINFNE